MTVAPVPAITSPARLIPATVPCDSAGDAGVPLRCRSFVWSRPRLPEKSGLNSRETTEPWCSINFPYEGYEAQGIAASTFTFTSSSEMAENSRLVLQFDCIGVNSMSTAHLATVDIALPKQ